MWSLVHEIASAFRMLPRPLKRLVYGALMGTFRFSTTRLSYAMRCLAVSVVCRRAGTKIIVGPGVYFIDPEQLMLGSNVSINHFCYVDASGGVSLGSGVRIGNHSTLVSGNHDMKRGGIVRAPIVIDARAWIGAGVRVLAGVHIGERAVVGAGAVVTRDVGTGSTVAGVPARVIKST